MQALVKREDAPGLWLEDVPEPAVAARALAAALADLVTEAFTPGVMRSWGLDYAALRRIKPDLVILSTCLMGQTGPAAAFELWTT